MSSSQCLEDNRKIHTYTLLTVTVNKISRWAMIHKLEGLIVFFNFHLPWIMFLCLMTWSLFCLTLRFPNASLYFDDLCILVVKSFTPFYFPQLSDKCNVLFVISAYFPHQPSEHVERIVFSHSVRSNSRMLARASASVWWGPSGP